MNFAPKSRRRPRFLKKKKNTCHALSRFYIIIHFESVLSKLLFPKKLREGWLLKSGMRYYLTRKDKERRIEFES